MSHYGEPLGPSSRLIRHCRERWTDGGVLSVEAFELREGELQQDNPHLSFTWLERLCEKAEIPSTVREALMELEECPPMNIKPGDSWIVLSCERIAEAIQEVCEEEPEIDHMPTNWNHAHVGVGGYDVSRNIDVADALADEVGVDDTYDISVRKKRCRRP